MNLPGYSFRVLIHKRVISRVARLGARLLLRSRGHTVIDRWGGRLNRRVDPYRSYWGSLPDRLW